MTSPRNIKWTVAAFRAAAAGLGTAVAGPLGGALFAWLGDSFGLSAVKLIEEGIKEFGSKAAEKLFEVGTDSLVEKLKARSPRLEALFKEALRVSLAELRTQNDDNFDDWFENWDRCLNSPHPIYLPPVHPDQLVPEKLNDFLRNILENLDGQGAAFSRENPSISLHCRTLPVSLLSTLTSRLPELLRDNFRALIVTADYEEAWKQAQLVFDDQSTAALTRIEEAAREIDRKSSILPQLATELTEIRSLLELRRPKVAILHQLPSPPADFTGRGLVLAGLAAHQDKAGFVICGMGGTGKTTLAGRLAEELQSQYPDSQFYLDLQGTSATPLSAREVMIYVITSLDPDRQIPNHQTLLEGLYRSILTDTRSLLFFDNAKGASQILPLLPPRSSLVIVTSRNYFSLPGFETVRLGALSPEDARSLLLKVAPRAGNHAENIARICGCLPYAIRLAAGAVNMRPDRSPSQYIDYLADTEKRSELIDEPLNMSYQLLGAAERRLWRQLAVFPAAFDAAAAAAVWTEKMIETQETLGEMLGYNVLEWDDGVGRYRLHDLARAFAETKVEPQELCTIQSRHASYFAGVAKNAFEVMISGKEGTVNRGFELLYSDWVNIAAGQGWAAANIQKSEEAAALCTKYATGAFLHLIKRDPPELMRWLKAAVSGDRLAKNKRAEAEDLSMLGSVQVVAGDVPSAINSIHKSHLVYGALSDRKEQIAQLYRLMELYSMRDEVTKAIAMGERALAVQRELYDRVGEMDALLHLGKLCKDKGEYIRSAEYCQQAAEINVNE